MSTPAPVTLHIDGVRVESEQNRRDHWAVKAKRVRAQKDLVLAALAGRDLAAFRAAPRLRVTFARVMGPRGRVMDAGDNLNGAFKACRDAVAHALKRDDGDPWWDWRYDPVQVRGADYGVRISFEVLPAAGEG